MRTVYVNGEYLPEDQARISIFDRGFLMADAVYEVTAVLDGRLCDFEGHRARLHRSLAALEMALPVSDDELLEIHRELIRRNGMQEGGIYLQVTRGAADRDFSWPEDATPGIVLFTQERIISISEAADRGLKVISLEDQRWGRRDIKTTQLLFPSWAKMQARQQGKDDAWLVEDGFVTEGSSNNAYIVKDDVIITRQLSHEILEGITRSAILQLAEEAQLRVEERPFTIEEAQAADEAFITSASTFVYPVIEIDGKAIGAGTPGPVAPRLREIYIKYARESSI